MDNTFEPQVAQPVEGLQVDTEVIKIEALAVQGKILLRGEYSVIQKPVAEALAIVLPNSVGQRAENQSVAAIWLGPNEWQLQLDLQQVDSTIAKLGEALDGVHAQRVDVSDYYCELELSGEAVREVLSKNTPFDMDAQAFAEGCVYRTRFAKATVILEAKPGQVFRLQTRWSYAKYVADLLVESCLEYQV